MKNNKYGIHVEDLLNESDSDTEPVSAEDSKARRLLGVYKSKVTNSALHDLDMDEIERDLKQKYGMPTNDEMAFSKAQLLEEESDESDTSESFEQQQKRTHS